jgi:hypothetical protein
VRLVCAVVGPRRLPVVLSALTVRGSDRVFILSENAFRIRWGGSRDWWTVQLCGAVRGV